MEGKHLIKVSVATGVRSTEAVVWNESRLVMSEQDVDDVAFLTGINYSIKCCIHFLNNSYKLVSLCDSDGIAGTDSPTPPTKKSLYENNGVIACSQKRALFIMVIVFILLFTISIIIAYTGPQSGNIILNEYK